MRPLTRNPRLASLGTSFDSFFLQVTVDDGVSNDQTTVEINIDDQPTTLAALSPKTPQS